MNLNNDVTLLIDAVVRQTVVLIAQLATMGGRRAPLAHVANQVFLGLVDELQAQGVNQKVSADMFGMALRTYQRKRQRLQESITDQGRSLWEALMNYVEAEGLVTRRQIMDRFRYDDENVIRGVLHDLVETGMIFRTGRGPGTRYRTATEDERNLMSQDDAREVKAALLWIAVYRNSPASREHLLQLTSMGEKDLDESLALLEGDNRIQSHTDARGEVTYSSETYMIPYGSKVGWAAAVFDHYQAMVAALCAKLQKGSASSNQQDTIGGSTFTYDIWEGHPFEDEVLGLLSEQRDRAHRLRERVDRFNQSAEAQTPPKRVVFYLGQNVLAEVEQEEDET